MVKKIIKTILKKLKIFNVIRHFYFLINPFEKEYLFINKIYKNYDEIFDVEANRGLYSYLFSLNKKAYIQVFEPNPNLNQDLKQISNINIHNFAVGSSNQNGSLFIPMEIITSGRSSLIFNVVNRFTKKIFNVSVKIVRLDDYIKKILSIKTFIKIDVEGYENYVLKGISDAVLKKLNIDFMIEIEKRHNKNFMFCFEKLHRFGYEIFIYKNNKLKKIVFNKDLIKEEMISNNNFLFSKDPNFDLI